MLLLNGSDDDDGFSVWDRRVGTVGFRVLGPFSGFGPFGYHTRNYPAAFDMCTHVIMSDSVTQNCLTFV